MSKIMIGKYEGTIYTEGNGYTGAIDIGYDGKGFELLALLLELALFLGHQRGRVPHQLLGINLSRRLLVRLRWAPSCLRGDRDLSPLRVDQRAVAVAADRPRPIAAHSRDVSGRRVLLTVDAVEARAFDESVKLQWPLGLERPRDHSWRLGHEQSLSGPRGAHQH
jgi:hypothetical protein